jgi:hypothetical protein
MLSKVLYWIPRILGILAILFMVMFSFDCFDGNMKPGEQFLCFIMHNIPVLIIFLVLIIAWRWEVAGGILFIIASIAGGIYFSGFGNNPGVLPVMAPFLLTGILFLLHYFLYLRKK